MGEFDKGGVYAAIYRDAFNFHRKYRGLIADGGGCAGIAAELSRISSLYGSGPGAAFASALLLAALNDMGSPALPGQKEDAECSGNTRATS
jgi:hypothetical protein